MVPTTPEENSGRWTRSLLDGAAETLCPALPVLVSLRQWNGGLGWREKYNTIQVLTKNIQEQLLKGDSEGANIRLDEAHLLVILTRRETSADVEARCAGLVALCSRELGCEVGAIVGRWAAPEELSAQVDQLWQMEQERVSNFPVLRLGGILQKQKIPAELLPGWRWLLEDGAFDRLLLEAEEYFRQEGLQLSADSLYWFHQDFIQLLYSVMRDKQVPAHILFDRKESTQCFRDAPNSIGSTLTWIFYAVTALASYLEQRRRSQDYTQQIRDYILAHLSEDLTRQELAEHVHLSQNHLARLFRQEVGMSISEYILRERMRLVFELLKNTTIPVGQVALQVGYENYSYFLTLFRRVAGMTPSQYREKYAKTREGNNQ